MKHNTYKLSITALSIALVLVATSFINIRLPIMGNGGLIHLGNVPLFLVSLLFGRKVGFLAGGIGMALFDLLGGWTLWAPFTFIIVGLMGYTVGIIGEKVKNSSLPIYTVAMLMAMIIKIVGYYIAEVILYKNLYTPMGSVVGNFLQIVVAMVVVLPIILPCKKIVDKHIKPHLH